MKNFNYDTLVLYSPEVLNYMTDSSISTFFIHSITAWILINVVAGTILLPLGQKLFPNSFGSLTRTRQVKFVLWAMECVMGVISTILIFMWVPTSILYAGTFHQSLWDGSDTDFDFSSATGWLKNLKMSLLVICWSVIPLLLGYLFQLCFIVDEFCLRSVLVTHHLVSIGALVYVIFALFSTINGLWAQVGTILALNISLEFPVWMSLMLYRLENKYSSFALFLTIPYEALLRIVIWTWASINYHRLCFQQATVTKYEQYWVIIFPLLLLTVISVEFYTVYIHCKLYWQSRVKAEITNKHNPNKGSAKTLLHKENDTKDQQEDCNKEDHSFIPKIQHPPRDNMSCNRWPKSSLDIINLMTATFLIWSFFTSNIFSLTSSPKPHPRLKQTRVAIVGGGIAGLGAALTFKKSTSNFKVDLFEAGNNLGGAAATYYHYTDKAKKFNSPHTEHAFAAFREYYNFEQLLEMLQVEYVSIFSSFTVQYETPIPFFDDKTGGSLNSGEILGPALPRSENNRNRVFKYTEQVHQLTVQLENAFQKWNEVQLMETTLGDVLRSNNIYTDDFVNDYLTPCLSAYVATAATLFEMPLALFYVFEKRFGLCVSTARVHAYTLKHGAGDYVDKLERVLMDQSEDEANGNQVAVHLNTKIIAAQMPSQVHGGSPRLLDSNGIWHEYDQVIFTGKRYEMKKIMDHPESSICDFTNSLKPTESQACLKLYHNLFPPLTPDSGEFTKTIAHDDIQYIHEFSRNLLSAKKEEDNKDNCHNVEGYNYQLRNSAQGKPNENKLINVFDANKVRPSYCNTELKPPFLLSMSTDLATKDFYEEIGFSPDRILEERDWYHMSHNVDFFRRGRASHTIQGVGSFWFAGAEFAFNFHEESFVSGLVIAERLGAGYMFADDAMAKASFFQIRSWMLYGINPILPITVPRRAE